jgi:hypothetical protein
MVYSDASSIINYRCGFCGNNTQYHRNNWDSKLPQCEICRKVLCKQCNQYGLCPDHFNRLPLPDQYLLKSSYKDNRASPTMFLIIIGFLILPMGFFLGIMPINSGNVWISMMIFPTIIISIFIILLAKKMNRRSRNYRTILESVIIRNQLRFEPSPRNSREPIHSNREATHFCHNCSNIIKSDQRFCTNCGIDLSQ